MNNWLKVTLILFPLSLLSYDSSPVLAFVLMFAAVAAGYAGKWGETCDDCEEGNRCPEALRKYPCKDFKERRKQ